MSNSSISAQLLLPDDLCAFDSVSDLEEPLDQKLIDSGVGELVGGGIGRGWYRFDLELVDFERGVALMRSLAGELAFPPGTLLRDTTGREVVIREQDT